MDRPKNGEVFLRQHNRSIMLTVVRHILYLGLAFLLQTTWVHHLEWYLVQPDLILLALVLVAVASGHTQATVLGFIVGFLQDTSSPDDLGLNALAKSLVGFGVGVSRTGIRADTVQVQVLMICAAVLLHDLVYYVGYSGISMTEVPLYWLRFGIGRALYTGVIGAVLISAVQARRRYLTI